MQSVAHVLDTITLIFWLSLGVILVIVLIKLLYDKFANATHSSLFHDLNYEEKLMAYLITRIERAGNQNNILRNDTLLSPMGFISALNDEKKLLQSEAHEISRRFNIAEGTVFACIDTAYKQIYNKYIE